MKYCYDCDIKLPENAKFCVKCGKKIEESECPQCGCMKIQSGMIFCPECGATIGEQEIFPQQITGNDEMHQVMQQTVVHQMAVQDTDGPFISASCNSTNTSKPIFGESSSAVLNAVKGKISTDSTVGKLVNHEDLKKAVDFVGKKYDSLGGMQGILTSGLNIVKNVKSAAPIAAISMPTALTVGGTVLVAGGVAYIGIKLYKKYKDDKGKTVEIQQSIQFSGIEIDPTAILLIRTIVYSANADGNIDEGEISRINNMVNQWFPGKDMRPVLNQIASEQVDPRKIAQEVLSRDRSKELAEDIYRFSYLTMNGEEAIEFEYHDKLAAALHIVPERKIVLEQQAKAAKERMMNSEQTSSP